MEYRKRVKVVIGQKPENRIRQVAMILTATFLVLGISDFLGSQSLEGKYSRPRKKGAVLSGSANKPSGY